MVLEHELPTPLQDLYADNCKSVLREITELTEERGHGPGDSLLLCYQFSLNWSIDSLQPDQNLIQRFRRKEQTDSKICVEMQRAWNNSNSEQRRKLATDPTRRQDLGHCGHPARAGAAEQEVQKRTHPGIHSRSRRRCRSDPATRGRSFTRWRRSV